MTTTYYFDTGVRPELHSQPVPVMPGQVLCGTIQIPFDCEDVPKGAVFRFVADNLGLANSHIIARPIKNSTMVGRYAFFSVPAA